MAPGGKLAPSRRFFVDRVEAAKTLFRAVTGYESRRARRQEHGVPHATPMAYSSLAQFMQEHRVASTAAEDPFGADANAAQIKCLLFIADDQPVLVILDINARVDESALASQLRLAKRRVNLAPAESVLPLCGWPVGSVPPFGHREPLPTIVDSSLALRSHVIFGDSLEFKVPTAELLRACQGIVADVGSSSASMTTSKPRSFASPASRLPKPWRSGVQAATVVGIVAQKRQMAALLAFLSIVPPQPSPSSISCSKNSVDESKKAPSALVRRRWMHPDADADPGEGDIERTTGRQRGGPSSIPIDGGGATASGAGTAVRACEVQVICGKTIERRLGRAEAARLFRSLRVGQTIKVTGRPQAHPLKDGSSECSMNTVDIVAHSVEILVASPGEEEEEEATGASFRLFEDAETRALNDHWDAALTGGRGQSNAANRLDVQGISADNVRPYPAEPYYKPRQADRNVMIIDDLEGLERMRRLLMPSSRELSDGWRGSVDGSFSRSAIDGARDEDVDENHDGHRRQSAATLRDQGLAALAYDVPAEHIAAASQSFPHPRKGVARRQAQASISAVAKDPLPARQVIGMDCEWQPCSRTEPQTPVSIIQIATVTHVFLVDTLRLCRAGPPSDDGVPLPAEQRVLSDVLTALFGDREVIKVGFGLRYDIKRLVESFPWLPCFGGWDDRDGGGATGGREDRIGDGSERDNGNLRRAAVPVAVPLRSHVDLLSLARIASDGHLAVKRLGLSSLARLALGVGLDKQEQRSEWGQRPLSASQISYAAADAAALVDIFLAIVSARGDVWSPYWTSELAANLTDVAVFARGRLAASARSETYVNGNYASSGGAAAFPQSGARVLAKSRGGDGGGYTQHVPCDIQGLMEFLGGPVPGGGKVAIVRHATAAEENEEGRKRRMPHFPRGSGLLEFENAFMLFVNVPSIAYPNTFTIVSGGKSVVPVPGGDGVGVGFDVETDIDNHGAPETCVMSWWPGRGQTMSHPVIRRLLLGTAVEEEKLSEADADGNESQRDDGMASLSPSNKEPPIVLLFVRPQRDDYLMFGRLIPADIADVDGQLSVTWRLLDYPKLRNSPLFQRALELAGNGKQINSSEGKSASLAESLGGSLFGDNGVGAVKAATLST